jgi:hypothetical protein
MKVADRLNIIDKVGRQLQGRYGYKEIDSYLAAFGISPPGDVGVNSKWVYAKTALNGVSLDVLSRIVDDLGMGSVPELAAKANPPANWRESTGLKLFISHISKDKDKATRLKTCLAPYAIDGFVAHEDIHPTLEWQTEIERALFSMDALVAVHTVGFSQSLGRIRILEKLGFTEIEGGPSGPISYILLLNPYHVLRDAHGKGLIDQSSWNALMEKIIEIRAKDLDAKEPEAPADAAVMTEEEVEAALEEVAAAAANSPEQTATTSTG